MQGDEVAEPALPQLRLDDLLAELQGRLADVVSTRDRVHSLLAAVLAVGSDLDLHSVLRRIVEAAVTLVDAEYGALGVISEGGTTLSQFLVVGVDPDLEATIGSLPEGHGVLGKLIRDPHPLRLTDLAHHPESFGFPPNHPPMHTFLGVPIRVRDVVFGNLYLTEKHGGSGFDDEDEAVVQALAAAAGVAIQNARMYTETRQRELWLKASSEVSTALLSGTEPEEVLALVARRAREVTGAGLGFVALPLDGGRLLVEVAEGEGADLLRGRLVEPDSSVLCAVVTDGVTRHVEAGALGTEAGIAVPLGAAGGPARGALGLLGLDATDERAVLRTLTSFATQAAVALELAERRREAERYAVFADRDRIARDLHDLVIQRLFATGMQLEGAARLISERPDQASTRVHRAVDDLDGTIRELRSTIYGLQAPQEGPPSLRVLVLQVVDAGTELLGFAPSLRLDGLLDTLVQPGVAEHLLAALRESLSNAARHAHATSVEVLVAVRDGALVLQVTDDGVGIPADGRRSGLDNLAARAAGLAGELRLAQRDGVGTALTWVVPLPD